MTLNSVTRSLLAVLLLFCETAFANDMMEPQASKFSQTSFLANVKVYADNLNDRSTAKVCACQLLQVQSGKRETSKVLVLSEKINNGNLSAEVAVANAVLENEKKLMRSRFYFSMKVISKQVVATDCRTVYAQFKLRFTDLKLYELLDADAISRFNNLNR